MTRQLLSLSDARKAAELRRIRMVNEDERVWRRKLLYLGAACVGWYVAGVFAVALALHITDYGIAQVLFSSGLYVAAIGPVASALFFWHREYR